LSSQLLGDASSFIAEYSSTNMAFEPVWTSPFVFFSRSSSTHTAVAEPPVGRYKK
jgi:hypothetical protein